MVFPWSTCAKMHTLRIDCCRPCNATSSSALTLRAMEGTAYNG